MADPRVERLAHLLVHYSAPIEKGDLVEINGTTASAPLLREIYRETLRAGGRPLLRMTLPDQEEIYYKNADDDALTTISPVDALVIETFACRFSVLGQENTRSLAAVDQARQSMAQQARGPLLETFMRRDQEGMLKWSICQFPAAGNAQDAGMSLSDYEDFVYGACLLDHADPVAAWQEVRARHQTLVDYLAGKREVHVIGPDTDLRFSIAGRTFINDYGTKNLPGGEVFSSPVEDSTEGTVRFSFPASYGGQIVDDVRLTFRAGRVVEARASSNEGFLHRMLDLDDGARILGECAFGTNDNITAYTRNVLFDEKIGGTMHLALGAGYPESGALNHSALHWDMVTDLRNGSTIHVDGDLFSRNGIFTR